MDLNQYRDTYLTQNFQVLFKILVILDICLVIVCTESLSVFFYRCNIFYHFVFNMNKILQYYILCDLNVLVFISSVILVLFILSEILWAQFTKQGKLE